MATSPDEANQDALAGLPDNERKETQEILDEIDKVDAATVEPKDETKTDTTEETKSEEVKVPPDGDPEGKKKPEARREAKLIPAWVHERSKAEYEQKIAKLTTELEAKGKPAEGKEELNDDEVKSIADKYGYEADFVKDVLKLADKSTGKLPADLNEKLKDVDALKAKDESEAEEKKFTSDFEQKILPLIKAEYGDDVPQKTIEDMKEDFKAQAYSEEYAKVPYEVIYKGSDAFRGVITPKKKGAEGSRGGTIEHDSGSADQADLSKPLSDEQVMKLSDADFDTYSKNMESHEKLTKKS